MLPSPVKGDVLTSWTYGRKAAVFLVRKPSGELFVLKRYKLNSYATFLREVFVTARLAKKTDVTPRLLGWNLFQRTLSINYIEGERCLEWVLKRFASEPVDLAQFQNFHGMDKNPTIARCFENFRSSSSPEAIGLKNAIRASYKTLHRVGWLHGSADPRNIIIRDGKAFIIDMDHARPSQQPEALESRSLSKWFGLDLTTATEPIIA